VLDAAIRADLAALAVPRPDLLAGYGEFRVPLTDGCRVGTVAEIEDRDQPLPILGVRSFIEAAMSARTELREAAGSHYLTVVEEGAYPPASAKSGQALPLRREGSE
jgi:hypothetical protein